MPNLPTPRRAPFARYLVPSLSSLGVLALLLSPGSCGFGSAAVASTVGNSGSNASPVVGDLSVVDPGNPSQRAATSPAQVRFRLTDEDGDASTVSIGYSTDGGASFRPITTPNTLDGLAQGDYQLVWDYVGDLGDESFTSDVQLRAAVVGGNSVLASQIAMGNDPPQIDPDAFTLPDAVPEPEGNVQVRFEVSDSAGDLVDIRVEFNRDVAGGFPSASWQLARPVGVDAASDTPPFALRNLEPPFGGQALSVDFFWESDFDPAPNSGVAKQMAALESMVKLRFTPVDAYGAAGHAVETDAFRIDNNAVPRADLDEGAFLVGVKDRGNIPIRFKIFDDESDDVQVAIQWKSTGGPFPKVRNTAGQEVDLATLTSQELRDLLEAPARAQDRRDAQIAREAPPAFRGRLGALSGLPAEMVRLPELASSQQGLLALRVEGRTLEVLRSANLRAVDWGFTGPVDAHIFGHGNTALILEQGSVPTRWQLREVDLTTGRVLAALAQGDGAPQSMDVDPMGRTVFVGSSTHIVRLDVFTGQQLGIAVPHNFSDGPRGLAALGNQVVLATGDVSDGVSVDGQLRRFDFSPGFVDDDVLLSGLHRPWGLALDPLRTTAVYLAERDFDDGDGAADGRVAAVDLNRLVLEPIAALVDASKLGEILLPKPTSIALADGGSKLLAITKRGNEVSLQRLALRSSHPYVEQVASLADSEHGLTTGPDGLVLVTQASPALASDALLIGGGVGQRRSIVHYDASDQVATLDDPLDSVSAEAEWRVRAPLRDAAGSPDGENFTYIWDSSEVPDSAGVELRVVVQDADPGIPGTSTTSKSYRSDFETAASLQLGEFPQDVAVADIDGDGDLDFVLASELNGTLTPMYQDDSKPGVFAPNGITLHVDGHPRSVAAADLDGDGDLDFVSANDGGSHPPGTLQVFWQARSGFSTEPGLTLQATGAARSVAVADLDGDGDLDLVSANDAGFHLEGNLQVFFQDSHQSFTSAPGKLHTEIRPTCVAAADLDGDGDMDLVAANRGSANLTLYFQTHPGVFTPSSESPLPAGADPFSVAAADLDGDGDMDLVSANQGGNELQVFFQTSPGSFSRAPLSLPTGVDPLSVAAADLDGDGDMDLVSANEGSATLTLFFQTKAGVFASTPLSLLAGGSPKSVAAADLDGDGDIDLVSANQSRNDSQVFLQMSPGQFTPASSTLPTPANPYAVAAADLDGDGDMDLVAANRDSDNLRLFFQASPGIFTAGSSTLATGDRPVFVVAVDLDGDEDMDLVSANSDSNNLTLHTQTAPGIFASTTAPLPTDSGCEAVAAADLDGDGDMDLVSANRDSNNLTLYFQTAPGVFTQPAGSPLITAFAPVYVATGDLDGDGDIDLVAANSGSNNLTLYLQTAPGIFTQPKGSPVATDLAPVFVAAADLDGDGDTDLVSANSESESLTLLFQDDIEPGLFVPAEPPLQVAGGPSSGAAADLDGDGDIDLVVANTEDGILTRFFQTGPGNFTQAATPLPVGSGAVSVAAADLDGDGDLDLVSANSTSNNLTILFNGK